VTKQREDCWPFARLLDQSNGAYGGPQPQSWNLAERGGWRECLLAANDLDGTEAVKIDETRTRADPRAGFVIRVEVL
jgi:hypothetical protein